jgi:hypothetical protein
VNYLLLARGDSLGTARVLAVSADQQLVQKFIAQLVDASDELEERSERVEREPLRVVPDGEE